MSDETSTTSLGNAEGNPTQTLTIQNITFTIPAPYTAGTIELTEGESAALNQTYAENIRNNFAQQMKKAAEEGKALTQADLDSYVANYAFGKRSGGGSRPRDPVGTEERRLAREALTAKITASGKKVKDYSTEQMNEMIAKVVGTGKFRAQAEAFVAARKQEGEIDLGLDIPAPEAPPAAA